MRRPQYVAPSIQKSGQEMIPQTEEKSTQQNYAPSTMYVNSNTKVGTFSRFFWSCHSQNFNKTDTVN